MVIEVIHDDNIKFLPSLPDGYFKLIYIDPPYNTGKTQTRQNIKYSDSFGNYKEFIVPRIEEAKRLLSDDGSFFIHLDWREAHYVKVWTDEIFGRQNFRNEIIWSYDYGGRSKTKWSAKHDTIFWYTKGKSYTFNFEVMDRVPYLSSPGLIDKEKVKRGKVPTTVWWHTIVPTRGKEKTGYPTQNHLVFLSVL
jgi:site-specific DNA-methyltransferase (adenine-specific)